MNFESLRPQLFRLAYGMLGSVSQAEDIVQEAWIRYDGTTGIRTPGAWLRTVVSRLALDELRSARRRRETYPGPWLPEPLPTPDSDPESLTSLAESLSIATLAVLEQLTPAERAAFLLREVFDSDYTEVAALLQRSEPATRQLVRRARQHIAAHRPRFEVDPTAHTALLGAVVQASSTGDLAALESLLAADIVFISDGGGLASAALRPVVGRNSVARLLIGLSRKLDPKAEIQPARLNGQLGIVVRQGEAVESAVVFAIAGGEVTAIHSVRNPEKLGHL